MGDGRVELQRAEASDLELMCDVHRKAMRPHVEQTWSTWDDEAQTRRFLESTDPASHDIVLVNGEAAGFHWIRVHADALELVRLYLLPHWQGKGIGSMLLERLCSQADSAALPLRLRVLRVNRAQRLYRRFGFDVVGETETHIAMRRLPVGSR
jgi:GNAT superfamily N-acetyltransferase